MSSIGLLVCGTAIGQPKNSLQASATAPQGLKATRNESSCNSYSRKCRNSNQSSREDAVNTKNCLSTSTLIPAPHFSSWIKNNKSISDSVAEHSFSVTKTINLESSFDECDASSMSNLCVPVGQPIEFKLSRVSCSSDDANETNHFFNGPIVTKTLFDNRPNNSSLMISHPLELEKSKETSSPDSSSVQVDSSTISPRELTELINNVQSTLILDCRPFPSYHANHISSAFNIGCFNNITRKRLQDGKLGIVDIISGPEGKEFYRQNESDCEIILYDENSTDSSNLPATHVLRLIMNSLRKHGKQPRLLRGGLQAFESSFSNMCSQPDANGVPLLFSPTSPTEVSCDIDAAVASEILPYLFIGNERDAANKDRLKELGITHILNVTAHLPLHFESDGIVYKRLPASDSGSQNLKQYFDEANEFIESARKANGRVLVHCQAGVSRSPTIVMAYMIATSRTTLTETFSVVKDRRPIVAPNLNFMGQLLSLEQQLVPRTGLCVPSEPVHLLRI